jgi:uncharacterized protein YbjT (DUF2867 family)
MADLPIVITGATGHIGSRMADLLLAQGKPVRVVGRDAAKLTPFTSRGAEQAVGSLDDHAFVARAFAGAGAIFAMIPPNLAAHNFRSYSRKIIDAYVAAIPRCGASHLVVLSSIGAHLAQGAGPVNALHELEERFTQLKANALFLRPGWFMENHLSAVGMIQTMNIYGGPLRPDVAIPMIATADIAEVAAKRIAARDFAGQRVIELHGPKDYTMSEVTRIFGASIAKPDLSYVQFPYDNAKTAMIGMGISPDVADQFIEMQRSFNEGKIIPTQKRSPASTTPTTMEMFAETVFAPAFRAATVAAR